MRVIYIHLNPNDFWFGDEFEKSNYVSENVPKYSEYSFDSCLKNGCPQPLLITTKDIVERFRPETEFFWNLCLEKFPTFAKNPFWFTSLFRLYALYLICSKFEIQTFIHMEYDNIIYDDPKILYELNIGTYFTQVGPECGSAGFMFVKDLSTYKQFVESLIGLLTLGEALVKNYTSYDFLSEMILIDIINRVGGCNYLPLFPSDKYFDDLGFVFDGASYGQYLGGTNNGHSRGWFGLHHWVGQKLNNNQLTINYDVIPYISIGEAMHVPIFNLHIHSKQLQNFYNE